MVGRQVLVLKIGVRVPASEQAEVVYLDRLIGIFMESHKTEKPQVENQERIDFFMIINKI